MSDHSNLLPGAGNDMSAERYRVSENRDTLPGGRDAVPGHSDIVPANPHPVSA